MSSVGLKSTGIDLELINGLILSDAYIEKLNTKQNSRFILAQSIKNADLIYKVKEHFDEIGLNYYVNEKKNSGHYKIHEIRIVSGRDKFWTKLRKKWYPNGKKIIPTDLKLTPKTISYWMMGDGSSTWKKVKNHWSKTVHIQIATNCFTIEENKFLIKQLQEKNIKATLGYSGYNKTPKLNISNSFSVTTFMHMIEPHILPCFNYKLKFPDYTSKKIADKLRQRNNLGRFVKNV